MNEPYRLHYSRIPRTFVPKLSPKQKKKNRCQKLGCENLCTYYREYMWVRGCSKSKWMCWCWNKWILWEIYILLCFCVWVSANIYVCVRIDVKNCICTDWRDGSRSQSSNNCPWTIRFGTKYPHLLQTVLDVFFRIIVSLNLHLFSHLF